MKQLNPDLIWFNLGASIFGKSPLSNLSGLLTPMSAARWFPTVVTLHEVVELADLRALNAPGGPFASLGARLLTRIWRKEILRPETSDLLLDIMLRSTTGVDRIKGLLPPETPVSHKTGTIGGTTNDAGIVTLPGDTSHVVTVVFVKASDKETPERERAIAHIARTIHDYFLFNPAPPPPPSGPTGPGRPSSPRSASCSRASGPTPSTTTTCRASRIATPKSRASG